VGGPVKIETGMVSIPVGPALRGFLFKYLATISVTGGDAIYESESQFANKSVATMVLPERTSRV
jgi:hypothetical protein